MSFSLIDICNDCGTGNGPVNSVLVLMAVASMAIVVERLWVLRASVAIEALGAMARMARDEGVSARERRFMLRRLARSIHHDLGRGLGSLLTLSITAPLVGILGSIGAGLRLCNVVEVLGSMDLRAFSIGIADALAPSAYALLVGVPSFWAHAYLRRRRDRVTLRMESAIAAAELP